MKPLLLLALGLLTALSSACGDEEEVAPAATATPTATPVSSATSVATPAPSPSPTAAWKTFTNTKYGYSVQYPSDWLVNPYLPDFDPSTSDYVSFYNHEPRETGSGMPLPPDKLKIEIFILENPQRLPLDAWVADFRSKEPSEPNILSRVSVSTASGLTGIQDIASFGAAGQSAGSYSVFFALDETIYLLNGPQADTAYPDTYEAFLNSFEVTQ